MTLKDGLILSEMGDEFLVTAENKEVFCGIVRLNATAAFIFNLLKQKLSKEEIVQQMTEKYNIDKDVAKHDFDEFVKTITNAGLTENEDPYRIMLLQRKQLEISPKGISMRPYLKEGRDTVILEPYRYKAKKYDIVLFKLGNDYVLHRIIDISGNTYITCGDNSGHVETVDKNSVVGIVIGVSRRGREAAAPDGKMAKFYLMIWYKLKGKSIFYRCKRMKERIFTD